MNHPSIPPARTSATPASGGPTEPPYDLAGHAHVPGPSGRGLSGVGLARLARALTSAGLAVRIQLADEHVFRLGRGHAACTWWMKDPAMPASLCWGPLSVKLAQAYLAGRMDIEGDLVAAVRMRHALDGHSAGIPSSAWVAGRSDHVGARALGALRSAWRRLDPWRLGWRRDLRRAGWQALSMQDDVILPFCARWLDEERQCSGAYFEHSDDSLDQAQRNKLDLVCRKLRLQPGERLLDVDCGWGGLLFWAARHHGAKAHGITLSEAQHAHVRHRIASESMEDWVSVSLLDCRDLPPDQSFDKACRIELPRLKPRPVMAQELAAVRASLAPGGLFLIQAVTLDRAWMRTAGLDPLQGHFPWAADSLDSVSGLLASLEALGFEVHDLESLRAHHGMTIRHWANRLDEQLVAVAQPEGQRALRAWRLGLAALAVDFEEGWLGGCQVLASKRGEDPGLPLSREDLINRGASRRVSAWPGSPIAPVWVAAAPLAPPACAGRDHRPVQAPSNAPPQESPPHRAHREEAQASARFTQMDLALTCRARELVALQEAIEQARTAFADGPARQASRHAERQAMGRSGPADAAGGGVLTPALDAHASPGAGPDAIHPGLDPLRAADMAQDAAPLEGQDGRLFCLLPVAPQQAQAQAQAQAQDGAEPGRRGPPGA